MSALRSLLKDEHMRSMFIRNMLPLLQGLRNGWAEWCPVPFLDKIGQVTAPAELTNRFYSFITRVSDLP